MKTYEVLLHGPAMNDYIKGRINGIIYALSGMPEKEYAWTMSKNTPDVTMRFDATEEQCEAIVSSLNKLYSKAFLGVRVVE
jgi:hypothetical protein